MSERRGGLGRGLAALIPTGPASPPTSGQVLGAPPAVVAGGRGAFGTRVNGLASPEDDLGTPSDAGRDGTTRSGTARSGTDGSPGPSAEEPLGAVYLEVPVDAIRANPRQPRTVFDDEALAELEHSVREFGLLQPIVVRELDSGGDGEVADGVTHELVMGERRWRAARRVGLTHIPAIVRRTADDDLLRDALLENIHRVQLNPLEEAAAYQQLLTEFAVTHEQLADRIGRSRPAITNTIRLLKLPVAVQRRVAAGVLSAGHARALLGLEDAGAQEDLAARIVAEGMSVRGAEEAVTLGRRDEQPARRASKRKPLHAPGLQELAARLSDAYDTRVKVELGQRKGRIVVEFGSVEDLERITRIMDPEGLPGPSIQG